MPRPGGDVAYVAVEKSVGRYVRTRFFTTGKKCKRRHNVSRQRRRRKKYGNLCSCFVLLLIVGWVRGWGELESGGATCWRESKVLFLAHGSRWHYSPCGSALGAGPGSARTLLISLVYHQRHHVMRKPLLFAWIMLLKLLTIKQIA